MIMMKFAYNPTRLRTLALDQREQNASHQRQRMNLRTDDRECWVLCIAYLLVIVLCVCSGPPRLHVLMLSCMFVEALVPNSD